MTILDTHIYVYLAEGRPLSPARMAILASADPDQLAISSVTLWEIMTLVQKGRLFLGGGTAEESARRILERTPVQVLPVTTDIAIASRALPFQHEDPADRFIAATAIVHGAPLITDDVRLRTLDWLPTL